MRLYILFSRFDQNGCSSVISHHKKVSLNKYFFSVLYEKQVLKHSYHCATSRTLSVQMMWFFKTDPTK